MNREYVINFVRAGAGGPEASRVWAESPEQALRDFAEGMALLGWRIVIYAPGENNLGQGARLEEGEGKALSVREVPNPGRRYLNKTEAAYELHCSERQIDVLITEGFLPRPYPNGRWLCTWEELETARMRRRREAA